MADFDATGLLDLRHPQSGRPLRVLITRPDEQAEETADVVRAAGGEPLLFPCLFRAPPADPRAFADALSHSSGYDIVAITSANAALALAEALPSLPAPAAASLRRARFAAVGPRTAAALAAQGLLAEVIADEESSADGLFAALQAALTRRGERFFEKRVLLPRAAVARTTLAESLRDAGATVVETVAYEMVPAAAETLAPLARLFQAGEVDLVPFGSPRTAKIALSALAPAAPAALLAPCAVGAIGSTTAAALRELDVRVDVVAQPATFSALLTALRAHFVNVFDQRLRA